MKSQSSPYSISRSPYSVIDKLTKIHEQNQRKERKAQSSNKEMILLYEDRKSKHQAKMKVEENQVITKFNNSRIEKLQEMKKKTQQLEKIINKFHRLEEDKMNNKIEAIESRRNKINKSWHENKNKSEIEPKPIAKSLSRSFNLKSFYSENLASTSLLCQEILERSLEKQLKVEENRLLISENQNKTKEINFLKGLRKMKAEESQEEKHNFIMKKSILKFEHADKRYEDLQSSQRKRSIEKRENDAEKVEKAKKKRQSLEAEAIEKIKKVEEVLHEKSQKIYENKENLSLSALNEKVVKRLKQTSENNEKYKRHISLYNEKMSENYKKDKEEWNFLTNIEKLKQSLIEKNIYQNNQLSLLK